MGRKPAKKNRTRDPKLREKWIGELVPIFQKNGIRRFSSEDIARQLGISKATLYKHFQSMEEIHFLAQKKVLDSLSIKEILNDSSKSFQKRYLLLFGNIILQLKEISNVLLEDCKLHYPKLWQNILDFTKSHEEELKNFFQKGIKKKEFKNIHPAILARLQTIFSQEIINPEFLISNNITLKDAFLDFFQILIYGIFPEKDKLSPGELKQEIDRIIDTSLK